MWKKINKINNIRFKILREPEISRYIPHPELLNNPLLNRYKRGFCTLKCLLLPLMKMLQSLLECSKLCNVGVMMHELSTMLCTYLFGSDTRPSHLEVAFFVTFDGTGNPYHHATMNSLVSPCCLLMPYNIMGLQRGMT
jgi:hypothetical protein